MFFIRKEKLNERTKYTQSEFLEQNNLAHKIIVCFKFTDRLNKNIKLAIKIFSKKSTMINFIA